MHSRTRISNSKVLYYYEYKDIRISNSFNFFSQKRDGANAGFCHEAKNYIARFYGKFFKYLPVLSRLTATASILYLK